MSARSNAVGLGVRRGVTEFAIGLRSPGDVSYMLIGIVIAGVVFWLNRDTPMEGTGTSVAVYILASVIAIQIAFTTGYGIATVLSTEREDGTLLRAKSLPYGLSAYAVGLLTRAVLEAVATLAVTFVIALVLFGDDLRMSALDAVALLAVILLGLAALAPVGFVVGSVFRSPRAVGGWGFLAVGGLAVVSGLIQPLATMATWIQIVGQASPLYWLGLGLRGALLPDEFAMVEIDGSWRLPLVFAVLTLWAAAGLLLAPLLFGRAARRESGSGVEARRQAALQRV